MSVIAAVNGTTKTNRTTNLPLVTYATVVHGYVLRGIAGPAGRREFVLDREISPELMRQFHASPEKRLLDAHKNLKLAACLNGD